METSVFVPCIFCRTPIDPDNSFNILNTRMEYASCSLQAFICDSVLSLEEEVHPLKARFDSKYICQGCFKLVMELEDFIEKTRKIQRLLVGKFFSNTIADEAPALAPAATAASPIKKEEPEEISVIEHIGEPFVSEHIAEMIADEPPADTDSASEMLNDLLETHTEAHMLEVENYVVVETEAEEEKPKVLKKRGRKPGVRNKVKSKPVESEEEDDDEADDGQEPEQKPTEERTYFCEICGRQYNRYNGFRIHMRTHRMENKIVCEFCNKTFTQKAGLKRHMAAHTGVNPYKCDVCDKEFKHHSSYHIHKRVHSGQRDHVCENCGMALISRSHLTRHMRTHTKEKKYPCPDCGKMFAERYNLMAHIKIHSKTITAAPPTAGRANNRGAPIARRQRAVRGVVIEPEFVYSTMPLITPDFVHG